jgi:adenosylhomocysteine nucleosidase
MRVAVVAAMRSELKPFLRHLEGGRIGDIVVTARVTGIGTKAAGDATAAILDAEQIDRVVMIGIAGGVGQSVKIGDLVVPEVVVDARGEEHRPAPLDGLEARGRMRTSDEIDVSVDEVARLDRRGFVALDMETAAVAEVCERRDVPWSVVRAISDHCDDGFVDSTVLAMTNSDGSPNLSAVARYLLPRPWRVVRLSRLARGARAATEASAAAAAEAIRAFRTA